jgi:hypothetical protein
MNSDLIDLTQFHLVVPFNNLSIYGTDASGASINVYTGTPTFDAYGMTNASAGLNIPHPIQVPSDDWTIMSWWYYPSTTNYDRKSLWRADTSSLIQITTWTPSKNTFDYQFYSSTVQNIIPFKSGITHHVLRSDQKIFMDGKYVGQAQKSGTGTGQIDLLKIFCYNDSALSFISSGTSISNLIIDNKIVSSTDIWKIYRLGHKPYIM